jgi:hypothetical protein
VAGSLPVLSMRAISNLGGCDMRDYKDIPLWKDVKEEDWDDWKWQLANRITTVKELRQVVPLSEEEASAIKQSLTRLRMAITPYYASLMDASDSTAHTPAGIPTLQGDPHFNRRSHDPTARGCRSPTPASRIAIGQVLCWSRIVFDVLPPLNAPPPRR